jgi:cytochrome c oxidase assembly protein subunit 15
LVSGTHAGLIYNTFPLMDGRLIPDGYGDPLSFANITANVTAVQFNHRVFATLTAILACCVAAFGYRFATTRGLRMALLLLLLSVILQFALGVATLLNGVPISLAACHQATALLLLSAALIVANMARAGTSS